MSDSTVKVHQYGGDYPKRYVVKFENLGAGEVQAIQAALLQFGLNERSRFQHGTSSVGECAEALSDKLWEAQDER